MHLFTHYANTTPKNYSLLSKTRYHSPTTLDITKIYYKTWWGLGDI